MNAARTYAIPHAEFEGPLELLLDLIEKRKLLINDVSLAAIADDYIAYARSHEEHPVAETADFVQVAATLLLIKSKSLLPIFELSEHEDSDIKDLEHRLKLYQLFRDASVTLSERFGTTVLYERSYVPPHEPIFMPDQWTTIPALREGLSGILANLPVKTFIPQTTVRKVISLEQMIKSLEDRILRQVKLKFSDLVKNDPDHKTKIVSFLAVLELVKQGFVSVRQEGKFDEIHIEKDNVGIPKYH